MNRCIECDTAVSRRATRCRSCYRIWKRGPQNPSSLPGYRCCTTCGEDKPLSCFPTSSKISDGHRPKCRECDSAAARERYRRDIEASRARSREKATASMRRHRERRNQLQREYRSKAPEKLRAYQLVQHAIATKQIVVPEACSSCGATDRRLHGHHEDYYRPLDVEWLCTVCHKHRHLEAA